ncbi:MAG: hypothetical protein E6Q73_03240 [Pseudorhodobacter sp.]|nr:MAG: hypothetical protein E6Q73_03240 [Pseudorhodobacter sp.]
MAGRITRVGDGVSAWRVDDNVIVHSCCSFGNRGPCISGRDSAYRDTRRLGRSSRTRHRAKRCKKPTTPWAKDRTDPDRENHIATASNRARETDVDPLR